MQKNVNKLLNTLKGNFKNIKYKKNDTFIKINQNEFHSGHIIQLSNLHTMYPKLIKLIQQKRSGKGITTIINLNLD